MSKMNDMLKENEMMLTQDPLQQLRVVFGLHLSRLLFGGSRLMRFDVLPLPLWCDCCCSLTCWTFLDMLVCVDVLLAV